MRMSKLGLTLFVLLGASTALAKDSSLIPFVAVAPDHWNLELRGGLEKAHAGKRALHVVIDKDAAPRQEYSEVFQPVDGMEAGSKLAASVWVCGSDPDVRLVLEFLDQDAQKLSQVSSPPSTATLEWQMLKVEAVAPPGTQAVNVSLQVHAPGHATFDDAALSAGLLANSGFEEGWSAWREEDKNDNVGTVWINDTNFVPWGLNYDRTIVNGKDLVLEEAPLDKIDRDFRVAHQLGANAVRLFPQVSRYMPRYMEIDESALDFLDQVILLARKHNLRVDLTGLTHVNVASFPSWYDQHTDAEVTAAEALFWKTMAQRYADEPAILIFDLQNEPFMAKPGSSLKSIGCFTMSEGRQFCYCNPHFREKHAESKEALAHLWTSTMVMSVRRYDKRHLITIGLLPTAAPVFGTGNPGFNVPAVASLLDVVCIHLYPDRRVPAAEKETPDSSYIAVNREWLEMTLRYAGNFGKPVIVEEWGPLGFDKNLGTEWYPAFMDASLHNASGWFTFYHALLVDGATKVPEQVRQFREHHREMESLTLTHASANATLQIDPASLWNSQEKIDDVLHQYRQLRRSGKNVDFSASGP
jgi:hypothetical protein